jgi:hypothetical protein
MGQPSTGAALARGGSVLAASLLFLLGVFHFFSGIAAFARDNFYNVGANYPYQTSNTTWGWLHVIGGVALAITGLALFGRSMWARWVAIVLAGVSVIINFFFLPYFPLWALVMIPLAIFAIWALVRDGSEQRQREMMAQRTTAGAFGAPSGPQQPEGRREPVGAGTYGASQTGQRWPENVGGREQPSDMKERAGRMGERVQEHAQSSQSSQSQQTAQTGGRGGQQSGRSAAEEAAERARQSADRDYRSGR